MITPAQLAEIRKSCPFCGGSARVYRELNCDTLTVDHAKDCIIRSAPFSRFHWNDPKKKPERAFADWERRANNDLDEAVAALRDARDDVAWLTMNQCDEGDMRAALLSRIDAILAKHKTEAKS